MDDQFAYILNALWTKHYDLGRIVRFRHVTRGRQAACYEVLTAEQREFLACLLPPAFAPESMAPLAPILETLQRQHFPVSPLVPSREGHYAVPGPQGDSLLVSHATTGQYLLPDQWTTQGISYLALRLAWLHRLLAENLPLPVDTPPLHQTLAHALSNPAPHARQRLPRLNPAHLAQLQQAIINAPPPSGHVHGDIQPAALLLDHDQQICSVVDWALLHPGDPLEDIVDAFAHWCIAPDGIVNQDRGRTLLEAYRTLRNPDRQPWTEVVHRWSAQRIIDAMADRRPLPRGFATILANPAALAGAMEFCETR